MSGGSTFDEDLVRRLFHSRQQFTLDGKIRGRQVVVRLKPAPR